MDEESTLVGSDGDVIITIDGTDTYGAIRNSTSIDTITLTDMSGSTHSSSPYTATTPSTIWQGNVGASIVSVGGTSGGGGYVISNDTSYGTITLNGSSYSDQNTWTFGDQDTTKNKIYVVEPWQSKNPIQVEEGLWVSLEKDLISNDELKQKIIDKLEETNPEILIKMGLNSDNMKLVKREVNLEIMPEEKKYK